MKTILLFLALASAALGQTGPLSSPSGKDQPAVTGSLFVSSLSFDSSKAIKVTLTENYDIVWMSNADAGKLLSVHGISTVTPVGWSDNSTGHVFTTKETSRPEKPVEITAELWTKDGKHWKAKWEEVK